MLEYLLTLDNWMKRAFCGRMNDMCKMKTDLCSCYTLGVVARGWQFVDAENPGAFPLYSWIALRYMGTWVTLTLV